MFCRGIRGATTVEENTQEAILEGTRALLALMIRLNGIREEDVASAVFTTSSDLNAEFPALAARQLGWFETALMCQNELDVPGSLRKCIRILIHWNTEKPIQDIVHVYVKGARTLRPDRSQLPPVDWQDLEKWIDAHINEVALPKRG